MSDNFLMGISQYDHDPISPFYEPQSVTCFACSSSVSEDDCEELETNNHGTQVFCEECLDNGEYLLYTLEQL